MILHMGGGGVKELAVTVQGGTSQPTGAAGLLWVNTATTITKTTWAAAQPSSPATGDIWIQTDAASANIISLLALTTTIVRINVLRVKQWTGSAWASKAAYYHNGTSWTQISSTFNPATDITYTGSMTIIDDGSGHWRIKLLTSGTLTFLSAPDTTVDVFIVGGGGGGGGDYGSGGGGGYTATAANFSLAANTGYPIVIGAGGTGGSYGVNGTVGGTSSAFGYSAGGGSYGGSNNTAMGRSQGGNGGSGGGGNPSTGVGGTDGGNGTGATPGIGQGSTTREFATAGATLYATGGRSAVGAEGAVNTGDGGGGNNYAATGFSGGSGIVVVRDHR